MCWVLLNAACLWSCGWPYQSTSLYQATQLPTSERLSPSLPALLPPLPADVSNPEEIELDDDFVDDDGETLQQRRQQQQVCSGVAPALAAVLGSGGGAAAPAPNPEEIDIGDE